MTAAPGTGAAVTPSAPERGELWLAGLDPVIPGEQGGTRPVLVVSADGFNAWPVGLVVVVPLTTRRRGFSHHIPVLAGGLDQESFAMPEYIRAVAATRLRTRLGSATPESLANVSDWLRRILAL